ncbi:MAG: hypothetical protein ACRDD7_17085 [Peptostreptococcaceae bacterium]
MADKYRYLIELRYMYNNKEIIIDNTQIQSVTMDYDYDNRNMPIGFLKASIDKNVLDDMIEHSATKTLTLNISKFVKEEYPLIRQFYINDRFIYFLPKDLNSDKDLDYSKSTKDSEDMFKQVTIGIIKKSLIDNNKRLINDVFRNTRVIDMIGKYMSDMKLLIEPLNNDREIGQFIVPPLNSLTNYIKYLDEYFGLYTTPYRLFYDFDKTYLLSSSGNAIKSRTERLSSVVINVNKTNSVDSKEEGMTTDLKQKVYSINVDSRDINIYQDEATDKAYNTIYTIDSDGKSKKAKLNIDNIDTKNEKVRIEKIASSNQNKTNIIKSAIEGNNTIINVSKTELDTSILTMNKEYIIKNFNKLGYKNGKFLLSRKREIYISEGEEYILSTVLTFRKTNPSTK